MDTVSRRAALQVLGAGGSLLGLSRWSSAQSANTLGIPLLQVDRWDRTHDRVWLGEQFWANPMEDWSIRDGAAECRIAAGGRSIHLLTHQLERPEFSFALSVIVERLTPVDQGGVGFRLGVKSDINEYRSNCFAPGGWNAGIDGKEAVLAGKRVELPEAVRQMKKFLLWVHGEPVGDRVRLTLSVGEGISSGTALVPLLEQVVNPDQLIGNVALFHNLQQPNRRQQGGRQQPAGQQGENPPGGRFRFSHWNVGGEAFVVRPERVFGPILWTMYSLSDSRSDDGFVLKLSALTGPLGEADQQQVELQIERDGNWKSLGKARLDTDAWVATFRIAHWNQQVATPYRVIYREQLQDGEIVESSWGGTIQANPTGRPLRLGALTCQNDYAFPYGPVANNLLKLAPDMLYFSGDQLYENHGGFGVIREPAELSILNYLRKYYQFGWSFREAMKDRPTLCIPDDHDVFQGNLWGEAGAQMADLTAGTSSLGGYRNPARMVNVVHKTCVAHHPDFDDPTPVKQEISVYYGDMVYGDVSFAILADRQWKSGPERVDTGGGRADHVADPDFDTSALDKPGLVLLGERQEEFLKRWAADWRGHSMKVLLSQTVFANVATHHGNYEGYLKADLDSGSWPQTPRNRTIDLMRPSLALHINGDQHLTSLVQYGVHQQRDSNWSFCTPAIAVGYPRWWRPDELQMPHQNRPQHGLPETGEYIDGLGNMAYVYAVGNPIVPESQNRYAKAHEKGSGFGLVTIDTAARTYLIESFRFLIDATDKNPENQFPGWPVTIHQSENRGENRLK